jgi:4-amino-4-deoxy-L-arabinose transferase-like glycosyltransferase
MFKTDKFQPKKSFIITILIFLFSFLIFLCYYSLKGTRYLTFSDSAKFAILAKNIINFKGYVSDFIFFDKNLINAGLPAKVNWIPPFVSLAIAGFFKIFGVSDISVILTSSIFHLLSVLTLFLIGKKIFGNLVGFLSALAFLFNQNFLDYAVTGASETLFTFEILLATYLFLLKNKWGNIIGFLVLVLMYFTKAQAIIYIFASLLLFLLLNYKTKKAFQYFSILFILGSTLFLITSKQGLFAITQNLPGIAVSDSLRGSAQVFNLSVLLKKVFYNLYNFYRLLPQIINPYLFAFFIVGLLNWGKNKIENSFKTSTIFITLLVFLTTALTIPLFRYIHPIVPLIYLISIETLVVIIKKILNAKKIKFKKLNLTSWQLVSITTLLLISIFTIGQTLGVIFLDSRFENKLVNKDKPPVYAMLSWILRDNTNENDLIVTNLDTWGSWYGERSTVWFPLEPKQLVDQESGEIPFDAIYLTGYLIDDENYYMGESWRKIFENPNEPEKWICDGCEEIRNNFQLKGAYQITASENYQNQDSAAVLLIKK